MKMSLEKMCSERGTGAQEEEGYIRKIVINGSVKRNFTAYIIQLKAIHVEEVYSDLIPDVSRIWLLL